MSISIKPIHFVLGGIAAAGIATSAGLAIKSRIDDKHQQQRSQDRDVPIDEFADAVIGKLDRWTMDQRSGIEVASAAGPTPDGVIHLRAEELYKDGDSPYPEVVTASKGQVLSARAFLKSADTDKDGSVTRQELIARVSPFAGGDGKLNFAERAEVLTARGLAEPIYRTDFKAWTAPRYPQDPQDLIGIADAVEALQGTWGVMSRYNMPERDDGQEALNIENRRFSSPGLKSGEIRDYGRWMHSVDKEYGNDNGLLSTLELSRWASAQSRDASLPNGIMRVEDSKRLPSLMTFDLLGQVDAAAFRGHLYANLSLPKSLVDAQYGGDLITWLEETTSLSEQAGVDWEFKALGASTSDAT